MNDIFTKKQRSEIMSRIRGKDTKLELLVCRYLRREGIYFQKHYRRAPGSPDVALPRKKRAVIIDGDFWHGWKYGSAKGRLKPFWREKIERNIKRDRKNRRLLREQGWNIIRVWEHELNTISKREKTLPKIRDFLVR